MFESLASIQIDSIVYRGELDCSVLAAPRKGEFKRKVRRILPADRARCLSAFIAGMGGRRTLADRVQHILLSGLAVVGGWCLTQW